MGLLLLLAALVLAFARPALPVLAQESEFAVVVVDGSASMQATDVAPTRFEAARGRVRDLVQRLPEGSSVTLIEAERRPRVLASDQPNMREAQRAVDQLQPTSSAGDLEEALRVVAGFRIMEESIAPSIDGLDQLRIPCIVAQGLADLLCGRGQD